MTNNIDKISNVLIIGAGHAGVSVATQLRKLNTQVAITLLSNEAHMPYHRPPLSKQAVFNPALPMPLLQPEGYFDKHNIHLRLHASVKSIDAKMQQVTLHDDTVLHYQYLVIATGTKQHTLNVDGAALAHNIYTYADIQALRPKLFQAKQIAVIGGGFIGGEFAAGACALGKQVSLLIRNEGLLNRTVAPAISDYVKQWHTNQGIKIIPHCQVQTITPQGVDTNHGHIAADLVVAGIGARANTYLAEDAGLLTQQGIMTDGLGMTSDARIYAVGDVAEFPQNVPFALPTHEGQTMGLHSIQNANDQGTIVANNIACRLNGQIDKTALPPVLQPKLYRPMPWFWSDQGLLKLQMAGLSHADAQRITLPYPPSTEAITAKNTPKPMTVVHLLDDKLIAVDTINHSSHHLAARKLLAMDTPIAWQDIDAADYDLKALYKIRR